MADLQIFPVPGIGEVRPGDDLPGVIVAAASWLVDGDVLVVTSKVVSKAEGRLVAVPPVEGPAREAARDAAIAAETVRVVASRGATQIVQTRHGFVLAAAGIDASNVDRSRLVLLPVDADASARRLRAGLRERHGLDVAVIITDTMGRPWRLGLVDVAIGAAGIEPLLDFRGVVDPYGNELQLTQTAVLDELAAAAELVKGKTDRVPVAVVRGLNVVATPDGAGVRAYVRGPEMDLFALGTAEARADGLRRAAGLTDAVRFTGSAVDLSTVDLSRVVVVADELVCDKLGSFVPPGTAEIVVPHAPAGDPFAAAEAGAAVHRLRATLAAAGLSTAWVRADDPSIVDLVALPADRVPLGLLAIGHPVPA